jgi:2-haloacid dehalogenase
MLKRNATPAHILVFDVNETLLNVNALRPQFERIFKDAGVLKQWFTQMLLYSQTMTQTGDYADLGKVGGAALKMMAEIHGIELADSDITAVIGSMRSLPAHPEVSEQLGRLRETGFRTIALTNSPEGVAKEQIGNAGLSSMFERLFSVDAVRKYKPARDVYRHVADELGVNTSQLIMIASHPWDLMGAKAAGCGIAFIQRPGTAWFPLGRPPSIRGTDLRGIANQLIGSTTGS